jgi:hypothetical protein
MGVKNWAAREKTKTKVESKLYTAIHGLNLTALRIASDGILHYLMLRYMDKMHVFIYNLKE